MGFQTQLKLRKTYFISNFVNSLGKLEKETNDISGYFVEDTDWPTDVFVYFALGWVKIGLHYMEGDKMFHKH